MLINFLTIPYCRITSDKEVQDLLPESFQNIITRQIINNTTIHIKAGLKQQKILGALLYENVPTNYSVKVKIFFVYSVIIKDPLAEITMQECFAWLGETPEIVIQKLISIQTILDDPHHLN